MRALRNEAALIAIIASLAAPGSAPGAGDPLRLRQWNLDLVRADAAHRVTIGAGVTVAVIDSGVDATHPDLAGSVIDGPDLVDRDGAPADANGHGTNVAGIIGAHAGNGLGIEGAAPGARILAIRVLDANDAGTTSIAARGIDAAVAAGVQVINLSLTAGPNAPQELSPTSDLATAIDRAANAGIVVAAAAGNDMLPICEQPVLKGRILCVGSVNRRVERSSFSNFGPRVDIVAPGGESASADDAILSTGLGGGYAAMAGTSQSTPHVAAAAALLASLGVRGAAAIDRIEQTARDLGATGQDPINGYGLVDLDAAVAGLTPASGSSSAPPRARAAALWARVVAPVQIRTVLRRGLAVRCRLPAAGRCAVRVTTARGRLIARGGRTLRAGVAGTVRARPTPHGRRVLRRTHRLFAVVRVTTRGAAPVVRRVRIG